MKHKHKPAAAGPDKSSGNESSLGDQPGMPPSPSGQADGDVSTSPGGAPVSAGRDAAAEAPAGAALVEPLEQEVERLGRQVAEWKDRAMRQAADLDNYRRRALRERDESAARAAGDVVKRVLDVVDDLDRVAHLDPASTPAEALHEGMLAIERKFQKVLEASGVERIDPQGQPFDPTAQEAVTMMPAPEPGADNMVGAVFQAGYRLRGVLLRPARVAVMKWTAPAGGDTVQ